MNPGSVEDAPELMHHIQSLLPVKEAARTSVLSKSWLHAWSTIPTLRFQVGVGRKDVKLVDMERTLIRYLRDNIPIERFDLYICMDELELELASLVEKCIWTTTMATTLKEISFSIMCSRGSVKMPDEILSSCVNLTKLSIINEAPSFSLDWKSTSHSDVVINCVSLRQLSLKCVHISEELLDGILSSCRLLMKIELVRCSRGLNTIKVKNLPCLSELKIITTDRCSTALEINNVPNLRSFFCDLHLEGLNPIVPFTAHSISLHGSSLTELWLGDMILDNASLDMVTSPKVVPFLETLTIDMGSWNSGSFHFTCASIKRLSLFQCQQSLLDVKVYAPKLLFFSFDGYGNPMPSLLFPISTMINQTTLRVSPWFAYDGVGASFFLKLKEALALSVNCNLIVETFNHESPPWDINIDDLRTSPPAMNVQQLSFRIIRDECMWERSPFIDAFFEICHPNYVTLTYDMPFKFKDHFCKLMLRVVLEKKKKSTISWPRYLKHVQICCRQKWETLRNSHLRFLVGLTRFNVHFKLTWH